MRDKLGPGEAKTVFASREGRSEKSTRAWEMYHNGAK